MILADTSIWIGHLRDSDSSLAAALEAGEVMTYPFILGELACGNLRNRREILELLGFLPAAPTGTARLWTRDRRLASAAAELNLIFQEPG